LTKPATIIANEARSQLAQDNIWAKLGEDLRPNKVHQSLDRDPTWPTP
jgi:hypothetical protein